MPSFNNIITALCTLLALVQSKDLPGNPFDAAETTITSTTACYSLPIQTATATKVTYNATLNSDFIGGLNFFLDDTKQLAPVFGLHDTESQTDLLFDISVPMQLGIVYPDQSAVILNGSGITIISADCSSVLSLVLPGFYDYLVQQGGGGGGTKKSKRSHQVKRQTPPLLTYPVDYYVDVVVFDQCGRPPPDPSQVLLTVAGSFQCRDRANIINGNSMQGVNGLFQWTCMWPSPASPEQLCEINLLRQLGYSRDPLGTLVSVPSLVSLLSQGLSNLSPPTGIAAEILNSPYFSPMWSSTMTGLYDLMYLQNLIDSQQLDPNAVVVSICLPFTDLTEYVWLEIHDYPRSELMYLLTSVVDDSIRITSSMQFNQQVAGRVNSSCVFSAPSTLPVPPPPNTNVIIGCTAKPTPTATTGVPARLRRNTEPAACTANSTTSSNSTTKPPTTTTSPTSTTTSWIISVIDTFNNPPPPPLTCSFDPRCDPVPSSACAKANSALPPDVPGCLCGTNVQGKFRCFQAYNPTVALPIYCRVREDCPGGMECKHENPCWYVGGYPGMCYDLCPGGGV